MWHFEFNIDADEKNRMVYSKIYGVWKVGTAEAYAEEMKSIVKPLSGNPWAKLIDLTNWKTAYPEAFDVIGDLNRWCKKHSLEWTVYIINQPTGFGQIMRMMNSAEFNDVGRTFRTMKEGEKFLSEKGYKIVKNENNGIFK